MRWLSLNELAYQVGLIVWASGLAFALVRGGRPERLTALLFSAALVVLTLFPDPNANVMHWRAFAADILILAGIGWLCFAESRSWLIWALGLQLIAAAVHIPRLLNAAIHNWAYGALVNLSGYLVLAALLAGVLIEAPRHARR